MTPEERNFYARQSATSDPGEFGQLLDSLHADPRRVVTTVSGLLIHRLYLEHHPYVHAHDAEVRPVREMLRRILERDPRPLDMMRPYERRMTCSCRHYALLAVSIFRHHNIPSRVRVGYATYFTSGFNEDHWLCEYWDGTTWRMLDAELGEEAIAEELAINFSPVNVPHDRFLTAGDTWRALRRGAIASENCGVSRLPKARGAWLVGASILRDLAALNARELLPWDYWGLAREWAPGTIIPPTVAARLDEIAVLTANSALEWGAVRAAYETVDDLRVPPTVLSYPDGKPIEVRV